MFLVTRQNTRKESETLLIKEIELIN